MIIRFYANGNKLLTLSLDNEDPIPRIGESIMMTCNKYKIVDIVWDVSKYPCATVLLKLVEE